MITVNRNNARQTDIYLKAPREAILFVIAIEPLRDGLPPLFPTLSRLTRTGEGDSRQVAGEGDSRQVDLAG
ncbi:hypothetical protein RRG08_062996 [Elysia crispata]|uniref:Uncharacterized protein n=1 Tax=Elysia crispata TaxID=231223 RepID=A0AAE1CZ85_9GAST|nr:hypothetical protein RRG08_062996 [Elysia crispata]